MPSKTEFHASYRREPVGAIALGEVDPDEQMSVSVYLKRRTPDTCEPGSAADLARLSKPITRRALAAQRAKTHATAAARLVKFAQSIGLTVRDVDLTRRHVVLAGTVRQLSEAFGAKLQMYDDRGRTFRVRSGTLTLPKTIAPWTRAILGFDQRPQVRPLQGNGDAQNEGFWPTEIARLYGIPTDRDLSGQCVGIVALGGGYKEADLNTALDATARPRPTVVDHSVGGVGNSFGGGTSADQEIALDLQILAGLLPHVRIAVYFAGNTTQSLADAIHEAVLDDVNRPQVLSISWGSAETFWTDAARDAVQAALADAVRLRVTVVVASGDNLASGGLSDGNSHVFFPASSPYVLGCGGTAVTLNGSAIETETVWKESFSGTGGGISDIFPVPDYQTNIVLPPSDNDGGIRRGVPDVAAAAGRRPGYRIILDGHPIVKDGTSAAAPLWAAIIAMANAERGEPLGLVNPTFYANPTLLRGITQGDNRVHGRGYDAGLGWNACTGLGVPVGEGIVAALANIPVA